MVPVSHYFLTEAEPKKSKKKKKKKKTSEAPAAAATDAPKKKKEAKKPTADDSTAGGGDDDLSMAILGGAEGRSACQVFSYDDSGEGHSVVGMTASALEELGLFEGDTVSIKGKRGKKTMASVAVVEEADVSVLKDSAGSNKKPLSAIGMPGDAMKNAGVRAGDTVTVVAAPNVKFGKSVLILPYEESLAQAGLAADDSTDVLFESYIKPYFEGKFRTLHRGDSFHIDGPNGELEFQCVEIDSVEVDGDSACVVVDDTAIEYDGEPIEKDDTDDLEGLATT